jgi:hypothetical protein
VHLFGLVVISAWGVLWSWPFFVLLKKLKRLKYGEIYEIVGLDSLTLSSNDFYMKLGLSKEVVERIEYKQRIGTKVTAETPQQRKRIGGQLRDQH